MEHSHSPSPEISEDRHGPLSFAIAGASALALIGMVWGTALLGPGKLAGPEGESAAAANSAAPLAEVPTAIAEAPAASAAPAAADSAAAPSNGAPEGVEIAIACQPSCGAIFLDGKKAADGAETLHVPPGKHAIKATLAGMKPQTRQVHAVEGEAQKLEFAFTSAPAAAHKKH
jgi:hypothetical protein